MLITVKTVDRCLLLSVKDDRFDLVNWKVNGIFSSKMRKLFCILDIFKRVKQKPGDILMDFNQSMGKIAKNPFEDENIISSGN